MAKSRTLSDELNIETYNNIWLRYKLVAINMFEWTGLPIGITEQYIENKLFEEGSLALFEDRTMKHLALSASETGGLNIYGQPLKYRVNGFNYNNVISADECVIIRNNKLCEPTANFLKFFVRKLTEAERTLDVNIKLCKTPFIFTCSDKDLLSFKQLFRKIDGNEPVIFADKSLGLDKIQVFPTGVQFIGQDLQDYKHTVENDLLTFLGVNNTPVIKKERLITHEAEANDEIIQSFCDLQLVSRQLACEEINKMFNLNLSVKLRQDNKEIDNNDKSSIRGDVT